MVILYLELKDAGEVDIPMYRLRLQGLYGLYGPHCLLSPERPLNLITHSFTGEVDSMHCYYVNDNEI